LQVAASLLTSAPQDMTVDPQKSAHELHSASPGEALYFDAGDHKLFGWMHLPPLKVARGTGLVVCKPFGYEGICAHQSIRAFAETAAAIGIPTLRFDYLGTGDSPDIDPRANQLEVWSKDVVAAIGELQRITGVERVCLLGVRLGAVLATMAAAQCRSVAGLILISPIVKGRRYLRELRTARLAGSLGADAAESSKDDPAIDREAANDGGMEASGYPLSAATIAALDHLDLTAQGAPVPETLIIDGSSMPVARGWAEGVSAANARAEYVALPGLIEMIMAMPHDAKPPEAILAATRDWLQRMLNRQAAQVLGDDIPYRRSAPVPTTTVLELPGDDPTPGAVITERPVFLVSGPAIFGILTKPRQDEMRRRAVILVNAGATYHAGPNRFYVSIARRWARSGYLVIRMDLSGLGDSGTRPGRPDNEVFPPAALDDIRSAIEFVRVSFGIDDVTLCGFCSGAYHALRAAVAELPVNRLLMVNPENFFWKEGTDLHALEPAEVVKRTRGHRDRIFSTAAWKRLMTGRINVWRILKIYIQRPLLAMESELRDWARRLRVRLPRDLGWDLEEMAARGVRMAFVFARGEAGIDLLRIQAGLSIKRLGDRCRVRIIDRADHIFSQANSRSVLETVLSSELFALNTGRGISTTPGPGLESAPIPASAPTNIFSVPDRERRSGLREPKQ